jgi:hypothetical protein
MPKFKVYYTKTALIEVEAEDTHDAMLTANDKYAETGEFDHVWEEWEYTGADEIEE